eukprot:CAMPEP_0184045502 /NCGR_PEP_ID=MMETSP0956-20121227/941_1 /TAXON_ID=627963 /ORGANISM="Aplanochytrium sp, Strain PBS07" /LENGTH=349 /DNA_ID=CAMNT_0026336791 /DNA_START=91 /DNA_END=1137 /DNA_ORIENTATION=-
MGSKKKGALTRRKPSSRAKTGTQPQGQTQTKKWIYSGTKQCINGTLAVIFMTSILYVAIQWYQRSPIFENQKSETKDKEYVCAGYAPEYRLDFIEENIAFLSDHLTDIILFSVGVHKSGRLSYDFIEQDKILQLTSKFKSSGISKVLVSVGGGGRSSGYSTLVRNPQLRKIFAENLLDLCKTANLDGIDLDWEMPQTLEETELYGVLIKEVKAVFMKNGYLLSVALHAGQFLNTKAYESVDRVNLMAYDLRRGMHSTLMDTKKVVEMLIDSGIESEKVVLGIPLYGRHLDNPGDVKTFSELFHSRRNKAEQMKAAKRDRSDNYYYNGHNTIEKKANFVKEMNLGGIFVW